MNEFQNWLKKVEEKLNNRTEGTFNIDDIEFDFWNSFMDDMNPTQTTNQLLREQPDLQK